MITNQMKLYSIRPNVLASSSTQLAESTQYEGVQAKIEQWLINHNIQDFTINSDNSVDVNGDLRIHDARFKALPFRFNKVAGDVTLAGCIFESLDFLPRVIEGDFFLSVPESVSTLNMATCPEIVKGSAILFRVPTVSNCSLKQVAAGLHFEDCNVTDLNVVTIQAGHVVIRQHGSINVTKDISDNSVSLKCPIDGGLENLPRVLHADGRETLSFNVSSMEGCPPEIHGNLKISITDAQATRKISDHLKTLNGVLTIDRNGLECPLLSVFKIKGLQGINIYNNHTSDSALAKILSTAYNAESPDIHELQELMIDGGFAKFARL